MFTESAVQAHRAGAIGGKHVTINEKFDVMIIDARFRRHCLPVAKEVLASQGIIVLHDAQKPHYQIGVEKFPFQRFIDSGAWAPFQPIPNKVWVGVADNKKLFDSLNCFILFF